MAKISLNHERNSINGWINLNKPPGITSADAVNKVKWLLRPQKIGHAGTLDPLATGVLPLALGEGTKCVNMLMEAKKTYEFSVTFGQRRTTDDAEGELVATSTHIPTEAQIRALLPKFTGVITQMPPVYSALKVAGRRACDRVRAGETVLLAPREVTIYNLEFSGFESAAGGEGCLMAPLQPDRQYVSMLGCTKTAHFRAIVSKGTYIRSLGRDIAQATGSEGYISHLHRAAVGSFHDDQAISLDFLTESVHKAPPSGENNLWLTPLERALDDIPALTLNGGQLAQLRYGQRVTLTEPRPDAPQVAVLHEGQLVALARVEGNQVIPVRLLNVEPR